MRQGPDHACAILLGRTRDPLLRGGPGGQAVEIGNLNEHRLEQKCSQEHQNDTTVKGGWTNLVTRVRTRGAVTKISVLI